MARVDIDYKAGTFHIDCIVGDMKVAALKLHALDLSYKYDLRPRQGIWANQTDPSARKVAALELLHWAFVGSSE
jgi:hypothetical protein